VSAESPDAALPAACTPPACKCDLISFERSAASERLGAGGCRLTKRTEYFLAKGGGAFAGAFTDRGVISTAIRAQCNTPDAAKPGNRRRSGVLRVLNLSTKSMCQRMILNFSSKTPQNNQLKVSYGNN
jgi:hypothetical protein